MHRRGVARSRHAADAGPIVQDLISARRGEKNGYDGNCAATIWISAVEAESGV